MTYNTTDQVLMLSKIYDAVERACNGFIQATSMFDPVAKDWSVVLYSILVTLAAVRDNKQEELWTNCMLRIMDLEENDPLQEKDAYEILQAILEYDFKKIIP